MDGGYIQPKRRHNNNQNDILHYYITMYPTFFTDPNDPEQITNQTRRLGLVVIRGTQVSLVSPEEGTEEIANPFLGGEEEEEAEAEEGS